MSENKTCLEALVVVTSTTSQSEVESNTQNGQICAVKKTIKDEAWRHVTHF